MYGCMLLKETKKKNFLILWSAIVAGLIMCLIDSCPSWVALNYYRWRLMSLSYYLHTQIYIYIYISSIFPKSDIILGRNIISKSKDPPPPSSPTHAWLRLPPAIFQDLQMQLSALDVQSVRCHTHSWMSEFGEEKNRSTRRILHQHT